MKHIYLGTGWKMNKTRQETEQYFLVLRDLLKVEKGLTVFVAVPFPYLWKAKEMADGTSILIGAQNMHWEENGAYTGEVSVQMLVDMGADFVELGHSERRSYFNETDFTVNKKVLSAFEHHLIPLVCVGESLVEKEYGVAQETIARQLKIALHGVDSSSQQTIWIAYEPVWAIGEAGIPATPAYANEMHVFIRKTLSTLFEAEASEKIPILYGGSVNRDNCAAFMQAPHIDGLFIGRAAWDPVSFAEIAQLVCSTVNKTY
jgi:triosephosphate isomerase